MTGKKKKQLMILAALIAILAVSWILTHRTPSVLITPVTPEAETSLSRPIESKTDFYNEEGIKNRGTNQIRYSGRDYRDPLDNSVVLEKVEMAPVVVEVKKEERSFPKENFSVSAIIWGSKIPQAVINDKIVTIGEILDGARIVGIDKKGVHLDFEGREVVLVIK